jgi:CheY-like chemotaxis protein
MGRDEHRFKLLLLADESVAEKLASAFDVHLVKTPQEAAAALAGGHFDVVWAAPEMLATIAAQNMAARATTLLGSVAMGSCVIDAEGSLLWSDARFDALGLVLRSQATQRAAQMVQSILWDKPLRVALEGELAGYELVCSRLSEGELAGSTAVVIMDASAERQMRQKMSAIHEAGRDLVRMQGASVARMTVPERMKFLEDCILRHARNLLHHDKFALRVLNDRTGQLELVASQGMSEQAAKAPIFARETGNGITGYVAATGRSYLCPDLHADPRFKPWGAPDARSTLAVPVCLDNRVIGVLAFDSHKLDNFTEADREFVEILAGYVALALNTLSLLTVERYSATTEIAAAVRDRLKGPLEDIKTELDVLRGREPAGDDPPARERSRRITRMADSLERAQRLLEEIGEEPMRGLMGAMPVTESSDPLVFGKKILVADDEEFICQTIHDVLVCGGAVVDIARDGNQAVQMIETTRYDLILSDIKMPYRNGYEVFAAARHRDPETAVILITGFGYDPTHSIVQANREGLSAVLFKPFKVKQLLDEVHQALAS